MPFFDEDLEKQTLKDGYATPQRFENPNFFTTDGFDENFLPRIGHNIAASVNNAMLAMSESLDAGAAYQRGNYVSGTITPADLHAAIPAEIQPMEKADPVTTGGAANLLGSFLETSPALALGLVNPAAAVTAVGSLSYGRALGEAKVMGLNYEQSQAFAAASALPDMAGAIAPGWGNFGKNLATRFASRFIAGATTNIGMDYASAYARADVLDSFGFHQEAAQQRHYDAMQALTSGLFGGLLNQVGHARGKLEDAATHTRASDYHDTESAPGIPATHESRSAHYNASEAADDAIINGRTVDVSDHINEGHQFVGKTPKQLDEETAEHWRADLDEKLATGEITPEQHAAAMAGTPPTYAEARAGFDEAEAGETGSIADIQRLRAATEDAREGGVDAKTEAATAEGAAAAPKVTPVVDALDNDDHLMQRIADARAAADSLAASDPDRAAALHARINDSEQVFATEMQEHDQYRVAAACAIAYGM